MLHPQTPPATTFFSVRHKGSSDSVCSESWLSYRTARLRRACKGERHRPFRWMAAGLCGFGGLCACCICALR
jgi:hypothetical protein